MNRFKLIYTTILDARYVSTQEVFAQQTGISRTIVSQLLNGKRSLNEKHILKVCEAFPFVNPNWLREGKGDMLLYDLPDMPTEAEIRDNKLRAQQYYEEEVELEEMRRKAEFYDAIVQENANLYLQLSDAMRTLKEKDEEISTLFAYNSYLIKRIQLLRTQLAGLQENTALEDDNHSKTSDDAQEENK